MNSYEYWIATDYKKTKSWRLGLDTHRQSYVFKCDFCNEEFDIYPNSKTTWCYKIGYKKTPLKIFCSYNCQVAYEKNKGIYNKQYKRESRDYTKKERGVLDEFMEH